MKRPTVKYNTMQIKIEIFDERCKVLHTELKINTKVGTRLQCPERALLNAKLVVNVSFDKLNSSALERRLIRK